MEHENPQANEPLAMIFEAENLLEAEDIEQTLAREGINTVQQSNVTPGLIPVDMGPLGGVGPIKIFVLESQQARAKAIIEEVLLARPPVETDGGSDSGDDDANEPGDAEDDVAEFGKESP